MSETKFHALSGVYVLIGLIIFIVGVCIMWMNRPVESIAQANWEDAEYVDWSTNPDAVFEATGLRPKDYKPILRGFTSETNTVYKAYPPPGLLDAARKGFILGLDYTALNEARYYLPKVLLDKFGESLLKGEVLRFRVFATDSGLVFEHLEEL